MKLHYHFQDQRTLLAVLDSISDTRELLVPEGGVAPRDGDWVLACFSAGAHCCQVAARSFCTTEGAHITFEDRDWERLLTAVRATASPTATPAAPEPHVLLVDNDEETCHVVSALLGHAGYSVSVANTPETALELLQRGEWQLLIADCSLGGLSAPLFCRRIQGDKRCSSLPILLMSGRDESEVAEHARAIGADDFIVKPFRAPELIARSRSLLNQPRLSLRPPA